MRPLGFKSRKMRRSVGRRRRAVGFTNRRMRRSEGRRKRTVEGFVNIIEVSEKGIRKRVTECKQEENLI